MRASEPPKHIAPNLTCAALFMALIFGISGCAGVISSEPKSLTLGAPAISGVTSAQVSSTAATITWITDQASDSQVDYGTSASYGASSSLNSTMVSTHSVSISSLTPATLYHYNVKSKNAAGLLAASGDFTFTTANGADTAPPTVSISSPVAGATVSGTITVSATASDNVGVIGVQFQVDSLNTGAELTAVPYALSLDTTKLSNGSHSLAAVARDAAGNRTTSSAVPVTVSNAAAPVITSQPTSQTVVTGQTATFSVAATGTAPLTYQWKKNGANISGATAASYTTPATTSGDNGSTFQVVVNNSAGSAPSTIVTLTVNAAAVAPTITAQPANQTVTAGQTATFNVAATGTAPLMYQWKKNGANISGAIASSYTTPATSSGDNGSTFQVVVSNSAGSAPSTIATLTVSAAAVAPTITTQPVNQTVTTGQTATFSSAATGTAPVTYQWKKNGANISGATAASYTTPATTSGDNGSTFQVVVSNSAGSAPSTIVTLTVSAAAVAPTITTQPVNQTVTTGQTATFSVSATGTAPLTYQWKKNGANISGAIAASYTTPATASGDSGSTFQVVVGNSAGSAPSTIATLTVSAAAVAPTITTQPVNQTVTTGQTATFSVSATGTAPLTYQWKKNGANISGAIAASYTTPATTSGDNGSTFQVVVSNSAGSVPSTIVTLTVNAAAVAPTITTQPVNQTVTAGQTATFSVAATGTAPLTYQWKKNGANISGATAASYTTPATTSGDNGSTFQVVVSNSAGSVPSTIVTLTVNAAAVAPTITTQPVNQTVTAGQTATFSVAATGTAPLTYQWSKNGANISGATSSSYTSPATTSGDNGSTFQVVVSNAVGNTPSSTATLTVTSSGGGPAAAALVQHVSSSNTRNNTFSSPFCYHFQLPNLTTAGNALVVSFTFDGNPTPSVSDDKGDSFSTQVNFYDSADTQSIGIATAFNIAAGARVVSVCFNADPGGYVQPMATEFDNVIGIDVAGSGSKGSGTSVTAGSLTPTTSGDLAYQVAFSLSVNQSSFAAGSQSNISWNLLSADLLDGWAAQFGLYNSTSAINPTLSMGTSQKWISAAVLLKTGSSGAVPSGMRIVHLVHENIPEHTDAGGTGNPFPNPTTVQFPSSGNLLVAMIGGGYLACTVTSVADSNNNAWAQAGATQIQAGNDVTQAFYAGNATTSGSLTLTVHWSATDGDFTFFLYDVTGAAASPLDTTGGATGAQSNAGNLTMPFTITPAGAGELLFTEIIWDYNTGSGLSGSGWLFDTNTFSGESQSGPEPIDQNNGWGHYITTSNASIPITWVPMYSGLPTGNWSSVAVAFKPAP